MSAVYNPEADTMAEIERLELEARQLRRSIEHCTNDEVRELVRDSLIGIRLGIRQNPPD